MWVTWTLLLITCLKHLSYEIVDIIPTPGIGNSNSFNICLTPSHHCINYDNQTDTIIMLY